MSISVNNQACLQPINVVARNAINIWKSKPVIVNQHNFVSKPEIPSWLTLSRLSNATYFNNSGELTNALSDVPRFEYAFNGIGWDAQGLLLEKQKTNFVPRQTTFENMAKANCTVDILTENYGPLTWKRLTGNRVDNDIDRVIENSGGALSDTGATLCVSALFRSGTSGRAALGFTLAAADNSTIYPKIRFYFDGSGQDAAWGTGSEVATSFKQIKVNEGIYNCSVNLNVTRPSAVNMRPFFGPFTAAIGSYVDIAVCQSEVDYQSSFIFSNSFGTITRSQDNLQLNFSNYTGSVKFKFKRQDTGAVETSWVDFTNATLPMLTSNFNVGIWLQGIEVYNRILTSQEKASA